MQTPELIEEAWTLFRWSIVAILGIALMGCASSPDLMRPAMDPPVAGPMTPTSYALANLPSPPRPLTVAVYDFPDQTGALKPSPNQAYADFSKAVTQGATSVLVDTLKFMGNGTWFTVVERSRLDALLRERKLIQDTYAVVKMTPEKVVSPLRFAEYLIEGGITSFDSSVATGGIGATYLGIGPQANYTKNLITVTLRMVEVRTGNVIASVTTSKSIFSVAYNLSYTRYVSVDSNLFDVRAAVSSSEPTQIAVREAIESAVYQLVQHTLPLGLWSSSPPEIIPPAVMASAMRRSIMDQSKPPKQRDSTQPPAVSKPSPGVSLPGAAVPGSPALKPAAHTPMSSLATLTPTEADLVFATQPSSPIGTLQ